LVQPSAGDESVKEEFEQVKKNMEEWSTVRSSDGIVVAGLSKTYKSYKWNKVVKNRALKNVSFSSRKGEILAILGQNGAGKTTMINILTTRMLKTRGKVNIFGLDLIKDQTKVREIVSLCPQFDIYWPDLTVLEHIKLFSKIRGIDDSALENYAMQKIREVGLEHRSDFRIKYLSGGMKRRLSIAIATIGDPKVIFLDEPTTGLDPVTQSEVMKLINVSISPKFHDFLTEKELKIYQKCNFSSNSKS
jgi:ABC-type multidrug transport system ATPase subunit